MVLPHGVDMWYDDEPVYDERYFRTLRRQTNDLLNEYEQTHVRATNSHDRTDKNRANELRKQLESKESELKLRKDRFTSSVLRENIDRLTTDIQACLYRLRLFPAQLAITDGRDNGQNPQQIANTTKSLRLLMLEPRQNAGVIEIQPNPTQPRPWHPPLVVSQTSAQQSVRPTDHPPNRSSTTQQSSVRVHGHSSNVSHPSVANRTNENRRSNIGAREKTRMSHTNALPHLHGTDREDDGDGDCDGDDASVTTFSSARSEMTVVPELVDITSLDGENEHENLRKKYNKVVERKKKLNDHFNDKRKKYDDECRLLLGKMQSLSEMEGNDANAQIGEEGQADMEKEFDAAEGHERVNRTRSWVNSQESVHPSDSASLVSFLELPNNNANQQNTQSPHTLPYTDSHPPTNTHLRRTNHDPTHHTQTNERADVSRTLADRRRTEGIQPQNHPSGSHQVESHPPQNHPNSHSNSQYHPQRTAQQMSTRQTYTVISQTRGENATATHILATECARLDTIPQSPRSHQNVPNDNIQHDYSNIERQRINERQITERRTNSQIQTNIDNNNIQSNGINNNSTRPKVRTNQQESRTQTTEQIQPRTQMDDHMNTTRQSRHDSDIPFARSDISTQRRASHTSKSKNSHTRQTPPNSPIYSPNLPRPKNSRHAPSDTDFNHNGHTSNSYLPQQKHEMKQEEAHNRSANNMEGFVGAMAGSPVGHSSLGGRKSPKISIDLNPDDENKGKNNEGQFFNTDLLRFFAAKDARDFLQRNRLPEEQRFSGDSKVDFESVLLRFQTITDNSGIPARELIFELKHYFSGEAAKICELYEGRGNAEDNLRDAIEHLKLEFGYEARSIHNMINNIVCNGAIDRNKPSEFKALRIALTTIYRKAKNAKRDSIFNNADTINRILVEKIPFCLNRWAIERSKKLTSMTPDSFEPEPQFTDFLKFLSYENKVREELSAIHHSTKPPSGKKDNKLMTVNTISVDSQESAPKAKTPAKNKGGSQKRNNTKQTPSHPDLSTPDVAGAATAAAVAAANFQQYPSTPLLPPPQRHPYGGGGGYRQQQQQQQQHQQQQQNRIRVNDWLQNQHQTNNYNMQRDGAQNIATTARQPSGENNWFCKTCNGTIYHELPQCKTFLSLNHDDKFTQIRANGACIRCLTRGHMVKDCTSTDYCQTCNGKYHHTLMHRKAEDKKQDKNENNNDEIESLEDEDD